MVSLKVRHWYHTQQNIAIKEEYMSNTISGKHMPHKIGQYTKKKLRTSLRYPLKSLLCYMDFSSRVQYLSKIYLKKLIKSRVKYMCNKLQHRTTSDWIKDE